MNEANPSWRHRCTIVLDHSIRQLLIMVIVGTRPLLGPPCRCRYFVSCTHFAVFQLEHEPRLVYALWLIIKRVSSCHPFHRRRKP